MEKGRERARIRAVWRFGKRYVPLFLVAEVCILVSYAVALLLPLNLVQLTDQVLFGQKYDQLGRVVATYAVLFILSTGFNFLYAYVWQTLNNRYLVDIKNAVFRSALCAKAARLAEMNSGDIMSRIDVDSEQFLHVVQRNIFHFGNSILLCAGILVMVARIHLGIMGLLLAAAVLPIVITRLSGHLTERCARESRETSGRLTGRLFEILKGLRELRLHGAAWWARLQLMGPFRQLAALGNRLRRVDFMVGKGIYLVNLTASLAIYALSMVLVARGALTVGLFLAVIDYVALLHKKFNWMLRIYLDWFSRRVSIDRVNELLGFESEEAGGAVIEDVETVRFDHVCFGYGDKRVLEDVSFEIQRGESVALVGTSGVGKSTIIALLLGLYAPDSGTITINNLPIETVSRASLRSHMGVVSQDIRLFDETVRYNLELGRSYPEERLMEVLEQVDMAAVVRDLPRGLDTRIGAGSHNLSGGQKQRLMIARMLLREAPFLILDEATSALDVETERQITRLMDGLGAITTRLVISHRLATIRHCDKIIVLSERRIDSVGTHEQLLHASEIYHTLFGGMSHAG